MRSYDSYNLKFGYENHLVPNAKSFYKHIHNEYELLYFMQGDADYIIGSFTYHLKRHDMLLIKPATYHYLKLRSAAQYERIVIHFTPEALEGTLREDAAQLKDIYQIHKDSYIYNIFQSMPELYKIYSEEDFATFVKNAVQMILTELKYYKHDSVKNPEPFHPMFRSIMEYIDEHICEKLSIDILSSQFFVSPSWIVHAFNKYLGISVMQYVNNKKILYCQELIRTGITPTKAAEMCAFNNYSTFYRQYKHFIGTAPKTDKNS